MRRPIEVLRLSEMVAGRSAALLGPAVDGRLMDVQSGREVLRYLVRDLLEGEPVKPGQDKGLQRRVAVDDRGDPCAVFAAMLRHRNIAGRQRRWLTLNSLFMQAFKGGFKPFERRLQGPYFCKGDVESDQGLGHWMTFHRRAASCAPAARKSPADNRYAVAPITSAARLFDRFPSDISCPRTAISKA